MTLRTEDLVARGLSSLLPVLAAAIAFTVLSIIGLLLLLVPGVIIIVALWVYVPAIVVEDVQSALRRLPEDFRAAVVLCDVVGMSYEEIGDALEIPVGTVRSRIHRGRRMLRSLLA